MIISFVSAAHLARYSVITIIAGAFISLVQTSHRRRRCRYTITS